MTSPLAQRQVAESCVDYLLIELVGLVAAYPEAQLYRVEELGFRVGQKLAERYTSGRPHFGEKIEVIKWVCKDYWILLFGKQVDNLRTNHKGVFQLTDSKFKWIARVSAAPDADARILADRFVTFASGLVKGALDSIGVDCFVKAEVTTLPACLFTIKLT